MAVENGKMTRSEALMAMVIFVLVILVGFLIARMLHRVIRGQILKLDGGHRYIPIFDIIVLLYTWWWRFLIVFGAIALVFNFINANGGGAKPKEEDDDKDKEGYQEGQNGIDDELGEDEGEGGEEEEEDEGFRGWEGFQEGGPGDDDGGEEEVGDTVDDTTADDTAADDTAVADGPPTGAAGGGGDLGPPEEFRGYEGFEGDEEDDGYGDTFVGYRY